MVSYLLGTMSLIEQTGVVEGSEVPAVTNPEELESLQFALRNVVSELKFQTASCATDKRTATIVELLARAAGGQAATVILWRCAPYAAFVAHNRYGSHVLQTLVALVGDRVNQEKKGGGKGKKEKTGSDKDSNSKASSSSSSFWEDRSSGGAGGDDVESKLDKGASQNGDGDEEAEWSLDPEEVLTAFWKGLVGLKAVAQNSDGSSGDGSAAMQAEPEVEAAAAAAAAAVTPSAVARNLVAMCCDVSATHVLRALLCVLKGVGVVAEKRGKNAKHGHSIAAASGNNLVSSGVMAGSGGKGSPALQKLWDKTVNILAGDTNNTGAAENDDDEEEGEDESGGFGSGGEGSFVTVAELQSMSCDPSGAATLVLLLELEASANAHHHRRRHAGAAAAATPANASDSSSGAAAAGGSGGGGGGGGFGGSGSSEEGPLAVWCDQGKFGVLGHFKGGGGKSGVSSKKEDEEKEYERSPCERLVDKLLEWDLNQGEDGKQQKRAADVVYGLAGEAAASHLLETIVRVLPDEKLNQVVHHCLLGSLAE
jgi:hypothetical protein